MSGDDTHTFSCVVVGSGHAGSSAAYAAATAGCPRVLIIDKCPPDWVGGNGFFTAGAHRTVHGGLPDLLALVRNVLPEAASKIDVESYTEEAFTDDIMRLGGGRSDAGMVRAVVEGSRAAIGWLAEKIGVRFVLSFNRQAYEVNGRQKFCAYADAASLRGAYSWCRGDYCPLPLAPDAELTRQGGMVLSAEGGGKGLIAAHRRALEEVGIVTWFNTRAVRLIAREGAIEGVEVERDGQRVRIDTKAVILACGGFESSASLRMKHLGPEWENAKVGAPQPRRIIES